jgi:hypothetical protein
MFASVHDEVSKFTLREARQFRDALLRIYGTLHQGIEDEGYEVPAIPSGFYGGRFQDWSLYHVDMIEGGVAQLLDQMHPKAGRTVTAAEVEVEIGWKKPPVDRAVQDAITAKNATLKGFTKAQLREWLEANTSVRPISQAGKATLVHEVRRAKKRTEVKA